MEENQNNSGKRLSTPILVGFVVVAALILVGLFLPPISLGTRLGLGGGQPAAGVTPEATAGVVESAALPEGVTLTTANGAAVGVSRMAAADLATAADGALAAAAAALPADAVVGDAYVLNFTGDAPTGQIALPLPADLAGAEDVDLRGWDGSAWAYMPSRIDTAAGEVVAAEGALPLAVALVRSNANTQPVISVELAPDAGVPEDVTPLVGETSVGPLVLDQSGSLTGDIAGLPEGNNRFIRITNRGAVVDQAAITAFLNEPAMQDAQIGGLVEQAKAGGFAGVHVDYQGIPAAMSAAFTEYVNRLADALRAEGMQLAITLGTPAPVGNGWDTGGQNWAALGRAADIVHVQMPLDPTAYVENGPAEQLVAWAVQQIDRNKVNLLLTAGAVNKVGDLYTELPSEQALANLGKLALTGGAVEVEPGAAVDVSLEGTASPLEWDGTALAYKYTFEQAGQEQTVWFVSEAALVDRLKLASEFNLRGATVRGLALGSGPAYAAALNNYLGQGDAPQPGGAAIAWTVRDAGDSIIASETGSDLGYTWTAAENPGTYTVEADLVLGETTIDLGEVEVVVGGTVAEAPTATPEATTAPTAPSGGTAGQPAPTAPTANLGPAGEATAVVNSPANVRTGPSISYGTIAGGAGAGTVVKLIGRNDLSSWYNITLPSGEKGWILGQLVTINAGFNVAGLPVVEAPPPTTATGGTPASGAAAAPIVAPPPVASVGNVGTFELGGQAAGMPSGTMQYAGMKWVKKQHKWNPGDSPSAVAGLINDAHAAGMKILLSIPGQLYPSSIDFEAYTNFLGGVAALGPDGIEVWNEMNIEREWPLGQIDPTSYVNNMLRPAYQKIKAANPNVMVITGAPAPTGFFGGCSGAGCDDAPYVAGMMAAGAGSVSDCVGVHYNEGLMPPSATSGDPRGSGGHYTRYFQGMINAYAGAGAGALCFTELGYLSGEEWGSLPAGFLWRPPYNLTVAEHAQYLAEAVRVGVQSGRVRMIIVFNVDFKTFGDDPQAGYAMIRPNGSCPACETLRQVMGQ
ncbi:MAG TPA: SH3 domain-containing protein [Promineifilum sp.]|nr:SH3 domain-containing protein [Promineifilum sp.]